MFAMLTGRLPFLVDPPNNLTKLHSLIMQGCKVPDYFSRSKSCDFSRHCSHILQCCICSVILCTLSIDTFICTLYDILLFVLIPRHAL